MSGAPAGFVNTVVVPSGPMSVVGATVVGAVQQLKSPCPKRSYWRVINLATSGVLWLSKSSSTPAPNQPGCYPLAAGGVEEFAAPGFVPTNGLWVISDGSTIPVTVETYDA